MFVIISCLGTLNGLMVGCTRGLYSLAARNKGPAAGDFQAGGQGYQYAYKFLSFGLLLCAFWLLYFYGANLTKPWFGHFVFDTCGLPIVTLYGTYIPIFLLLMKKEKTLPPFKRYVMPILSVLGCIFMVVAACLAHGLAVVYYLIVFVAIMLIGVYYQAVHEPTVVHPDSVRQQAEHSA